MIHQSIPVAFKVMLLQMMEKDDIRMALYTKDAELGPTLQSYTTKGEATGRNYMAGGTKLTGLKVMRAGERGVGITWDSPVMWPDSEITARGALIYNASRSNTPLAVLDFGKDVTSTDHNFEVAFSTAGVIGF